MLTKRSPFISGPRGLLLSALVFAAGCSQCSEQPPGTTGDDMSPPSADMVVPAEMETPVGDCRDTDGDGFGVGAGCTGPQDCNDTDNSVYPGAPELCGDNIDNNCNGMIDEGCPCSLGALRICSSSGFDPATFGPRTRCKAGVQRCDRGDWSEVCEGELGPEPETCDSWDNDCDGTIDEGLRNAFGLCIDDLPADYMPPEESCGATGEGSGLDEDGDGKVDEGCSCGLPDGAPDSAGYRVNQPCYDGPPLTLGVGACRGGVRDCVAGEWGTCTGTITPTADICGDGVDNDCNGLIDETCPTCIPTGAELCDGIDNDCDGIIDEGVRNACGGCGPVADMEVCGDGLDNNCNGQIDEGCFCSTVDQDCYGGPPETAGVGICAWGTQTCSGEQYGACEGAVLPQIESCGADGFGDGLDNDCDGQVDEGCGECQNGATRLCGSSTGVCEHGTQTCTGNAWGPCEGGSGRTEQPETSCDGLDNDCDGLTDEGLRNACGTCGEPCYNQPLDPTTIGQRDDGVDLISASDPANPRPQAGITLGQNSSFPAFLWTANTTTNGASKIDTKLDQEVGRYWVGANPSRTAIDLDANMWVAGRNDGRITKILWNEQDCGRLDRNMNGVVDTSRRDATGVVNVVNSQANPLADECVEYSEVLNDSFPSIRGIAVPSDGLVWFGFSVGAPGGSNGVQGINPRTFEKTDVYIANNIPLWDRDPTTGVHTLGNATADLGSVYGLISDSKGNVWGADWASRTGIAKFDPIARQWTEFYNMPDCGTYGIAVDSEDRLWMGCWGPAAPIVSVFDTNTKISQSFYIPSASYPNNPRPANGTVVPIQLSSDSTASIRTSALGIEPATSDIWITHNDGSGFISRLTYNEQDPAASTITLIRATTDDNGSAISGVNNGRDMRGVGFDSDGFAWHLGMDSENAIKIDPATNQRLLTVEMPGAGGHYTYSDFSGSSVFSITAPRGVWRHTFSTGFPQAIVSTLLISAEVPPQTTLGLRIRTLDGNNNPVGDWIPAPVTGPIYELYPTGAMSHVFNLSSFGGPLIGQNFEIELQFQTTDRDVRPIIYDVQLGWSRP